ncbi:hypothetical protein WJX73_009356 [Symbiochloris irregularis]|uniref:Uncharacterized protein n=1 Tax=Symbiochloris irregularis TaxID=706552 RepID=A0AAW1PW57_9CHLO
MTSQQGPTTGKQAFDVESQQVQQPIDKVPVNQSVGDLAQRSEAASNLDESNSGADRQNSRIEHRKMIGQHPMWQPGAVDHVRAYFLSPYFQASIQLAASILLLSVFLFVEQLHFSEDNIGAILLTIPMILAALDLGAGGRVFGSAVLASAAWGAVIGGIILTVAEYTHAYGTFLTILTVIFFGLLAFIRVADFIKGLMLAILAGIVIVLGQFVWPAEVLWTKLVWALVKAIWLASFAATATGLLVFATSVREKVPRQLSHHMRDAGHALSSIAAHVMPPCDQGDLSRMQSKRVTSDVFGSLDHDSAHEEPHNASQGDAGKEHPGKHLQHPSLQGVAHADLLHPSVVANLRRAADPEADHSLRHLADPATKTTSKLRAALAQTGLQAKLLAPFEPAWYGTCRVDVARWGKILQLMQPLVTRIAVLESLLEGHEPMMHSQVFMEEFGVNPLPTYKLMLATAAASIAHMSKCIGAAGRGDRIHRNCLIANCHKEAQMAEAREVTQAVLASHLKNVSSGRDFLGLGVHRRLYNVLRMESLEVYDKVCALEKAVEAALTQQIVYSWPWQWSIFGRGSKEDNGKAKGGWWSTVRKRVELELQPVTLFLTEMLGINFYRVIKGLILQSAPQCFGTWHNTVQTIKKNRHFRFGLLWFGVTTVVVCLIIPLSIHSGLVRRNRQYFMIIAAVSSFQERADNSLQRIVFRLLMSAIAASLGLAIMHGHPLASNPYGLTALTCTWGFLMGIVQLTAYKYAAFLSVMVLNAMIYNQFNYDRAPNATGKTAYYIARLSEYGLGMLVALIFTVLDPWYLSDDALQQVGAASKRCVELSCRTVEAYLEEVSLLEDLGPRDQVPSESKLQAENGSGAGEVDASQKAPQGVVRRGPNKAGGDEASRKLSMSPSKKAGGKEPDKKGIASLDPMSLLNQVALPLGGLGAQVAREKVAWHHGPLILPPIVPQSMQRLQLLLERASLLEMMVRQDAISSHKFTSYPHTPLQNMDSQIRAQLQAMRRTACVLCGTLASLGSQCAEDGSVEELLQALQELNVTRFEVSAATRKVQKEARAMHRAQGATSLCEGATEDDLLRMYGVLIGLEKMGAQLQLFGTILTRDAWLSRSLQEGWWQRRLRLFKIS